MIVPSPTAAKAAAVTCLPSFDASLVCHLISASADRRLAGKPGGLLYVEPPNPAPEARQAVQQGWSKWLVQHDFDTQKSTLASLAKPYLRLGFLFGEPEFGLSPDVALPMYLADHDVEDAVTIESDEIGKQLASTPSGSLYTVDLNDHPDGSSTSTIPVDAQWKCDWHTPEICCILSAEQGLRMNCAVNTQEEQPTNFYSDDDDDDDNSINAMSSATVNLVQAYSSSSGPSTTHWRLIENGDGTIAISSHDEKYVLGDSWESQVTLTSPEGGPVPHWRVRKRSERGVLLQSVATKRFLTMERDRFVMRDEPDATNSLFALEPIHGSTFTIVHAQHNKVEGLSDCLIKVFDNGNVIIKQNGQFFGECYWKNTYLGVGLSERPFVWNFEATDDGYIRIVTKGKKQYLRHDGKQFSLGNINESEAKDGDDDKNDPESYLWKIKATNDKITVGVRYGLLPKSIQKSAQSEWPGIHPFQATLRMSGRYPRPFANWRAWPVEQPVAAPPAPAPVAAVNGSQPQPVAVQEPVVAAVAAAPVPEPQAAVAQPVTVPPPVAQPVAPAPAPQPVTETIAPPVLPKSEYQPPPAVAPVVAPPPPAPVVSEQPLPPPPPATPPPPQPEPKTEEPIWPLGGQDQAPPAAEYAKSTDTLWSVSEKPTLNEHAARRQEEDGFKYLGAEEGYRFFSADTQQPPPDATPTTNWPEFSSTTTSEEPAQPRSVNGRILAADNSSTSTGHRRGPNYSSSDDEPKAPRVFSVDRR